MLKLTDRQRKKAIADYVNGESIRSISRRLKVAPSTIKRIIDADPKTKQAATDKKDENTLDMLAYMDGKTREAQSFIDACMTEMLTPGRLEKAKLSEITTAMGTVIDKWTNVGKLNESALSKLDQIIGGLDDAAKS